MHLRVSCGCERCVSRRNYLLERLREAAQTLLEGHDISAAHTVAACVEVLEEMFHVEHALQIPLTTGNGSPFSSGETRSNGESERSRSDSDDHVREPFDFKPPGLAPGQADLDRARRDWAQHKTLRSTLQASRKAARRGKFRGKLSRRRGR